MEFPIAFAALVFLAAFLFFMGLRMLWQSHRSAAAVKMAARLRASMASPGPARNTRGKPPGKPGQRSNSN